MNTNLEHQCKQGLICIDCKEMFCQKCKIASKHKDHITFKTKSFLKNSKENCQQVIRNNAEQESIKNIIKSLRQQSKKLKLSTQQIIQMNESQGYLLPQIQELEKLQKGLLNKIIEKQQETELNILKQPDNLVKILQEELAEQKEVLAHSLQQNTQQNPPPPPKKIVKFIFIMQAPQNQNQQIDQIPQNQFAPSRNEQEQRQINLNTYSASHSEILQISQDPERFLILDSQNNLIIYNIINQNKERFQRKFQQIQINKDYLVAQDLQDNFLIYSTNPFKMITKIHCQTSCFQLLPSNEIMCVKGQCLYILHVLQKLPKKQHQDQKEIKSFLVFPRYDCIVLNLMSGFKVISTKNKDPKDYSHEPQAQNIEELKYLNEEKCIILHREVIHIFNVQFQTFSNSIWIGKCSFIKPVLNTEWIFIINNNEERQSQSNIILKDLLNEKDLLSIKTGAQSIILSQKKDVVILQDQQGKIQRLWLKDY